MPHDRAEPMTAARWTRVKAIVQEALAHDATERDRFVAAACAGDDGLATEVTSLLAAHDSAGPFLEHPPAGISPASIAASQPGRRLGPYVIVRELGHGGMGVVYLAARDDDEYRKLVAIKMIRASVDTAVLQERFRYERQILADLEHPSIARLVDGGSTPDGVPYLVMEYVDGLPIDQFCRANALSVDDRLALFRSVCAAVQYAHRHLVVHRDLKAANVLVTAVGEPKLLDFGIAKLLDADTDRSARHTATAMRPMSLESASPEQVCGERITTATDVYALG